MARFTMEKFQRGEHVAMLREHGLSPGHMKMLTMLDPDQPKPMGVMADMMHCDASQVTWLVDRLEEPGFVERRTLPGDRRVKTIALTPVGVEFRRRIVDLMFEPPAELLQADAATLERLREDLETLPMPEHQWFEPGRGPEARAGRTDVRPSRAVG